ncbi:MAG: hypothetical protein HN736_00275 [Anaerolineae bacterium]|nr:hypothetical protein [Anaerolineae bacterium]MBT6320721.1 hypothetical protein [Anaerolineae bacterium]MBT6811061.1 hypothetical protein [Anaerolineae bacterium]MBT7016598.1 hypothetical protein [Anaerolineae bacterium]MBT7600383.1 hypothetical protein [Anaerolineae bacterium]
MKCRVARDLNLRGTDDHLLDLNVIPLKTRISLGAVPKPKPRAERFYIPIKRTSHQTV